MIAKTVLLAAATLALAACGGGGISDNEVLNKIDAEMERRGLDNGSASPVAPTVPTPPVSMAGFDRALLIGRWSDAPGCQDIITDFLEDGTFRVGQGRGTWRLEGNRLTIGRGDGQETTLTVDTLTATEFRMTSPAGERLRSYRCNQQTR